MLDMCSNGLHARLPCRLVFVDRFTIRLLGEQIKHGGHLGDTIRTGHPVTSHYDKRKKKDGRKTAARKWRQEFINSNFTKDEVDQLALQAARELRTKESAIKPLREEVETRQARQDAASWRVKKQQPGAYAELVAARQSLREKRTGLLQEELDLKRLRQHWYRLNKMSEAAGKMKRSKSGSSQNTAAAPSPSMTTPTPDWPTVEDSSKYLDISQLRGPGGPILAWSGTDYGISKMSETVALPYAGIRTHLNRYQTLYGTFEWIVCRA